MNISYIKESFHRLLPICLPGCLLLFEVLVIPEYQLSDLLFQALVLLLQCFDLCASLACLGLVLRLLLLVLDGACTEFIQLSFKSLILFLHCLFLLKFGSEGHELTLKVHDLRGYLLVVGVDGLGFLNGRLTVENRGGDVPKRLLGLLRLSL